MKYTKLLFYFQNLPNKPYKTSKAQVGRVFRIKPGFLPSPYLQCCQLVFDNMILYLRE